MVFYFALGSLESEVTGDTEVVFLSIFYFIWDWTPNESSLLQANLDFDFYVRPPPDAPIIGDVTFQDLVTMKKNCSVKHKHQDGFVLDTLFHKICQMYIQTMSDIIEDAKDYVHQDV